MGTSRGSCGYLNFSCTDDLLKHLEACAHQLPQTVERARLEAVNHGKEKSLYVSASRNMAPEGGFYILIGGGAIGTHCDTPSQALVARQPSSLQLPQMPVVNHARHNSLESGQMPLFYNAMCTRYGACSLVFPSCTRY